MKNLDLMGVQELDALEIKDIFGGDEPGYAIGYYARQAWDFVSNLSMPDFGAIYDYAMFQWERR